MIASCTMFFVIAFSIRSEFALLNPISESLGPPIAKRPSPIAVAPMPHVAPLKIERPHIFYGTVKAISGTSITISGTAKRNGKVRNCTFILGAYLQNGDQDPREATSRDYRIQDVRKGDTVSVVLHEQGDDDICASIQIHERPGGVVPPAPWDEADPRNR